MKEKLIDLFPELNLIEDEDLRERTLSPPMPGRAMGVTAPQRP